MSDMIDRLRAISAGAGRDIATDLAAPSTIEAMASRVRAGVRRRRIRLGAIGATAAVIVGAAVIAAPTLLSALPDQPNVVQPGIIRTVGPITTYDNGSLSVVLSSGELVSLPPYEGDLELTQPSREELCAIASPDELPSGSWVSTIDEANLIIGKAKLWVTDDSNVMMHGLIGAVIDVADPKNDPPVFIAGFEVDPAVAPFVAIKTTVVEFKVDPYSMSGTGYYNIYSKGSLAGEPALEYSGTSDLGTRVGTVESSPMDLKEWSACYMYPDVLTEDFWKGTFKWYVVAEIYLVDRKGGAYPLGTATYWVKAEVDA